MAFASTFTQLLVDSDETRAMTRANKILNEEVHPTGSRSSGSKRLIDSDYKDLAFIRWTKSAVNLHNNHVGRQVSHLVVLE